MTSYTRRAFFGFAWVTLGAIIANLFGYLLRLILARNLTVAEYGLIYAVMALFGLAAIFQHLGLGEALIRYIAQYGVRKDMRGSKEIVVWTTRILYASTFLIALIAFLCADILGSLYFKSAIAPTLIRIYAIGFFLSPIMIIAPSVFQGRQRMELTALAVATQSVVLFFGAWLFLWLGHGVTSIMYAYLLVYLALYLFLPFLIARVAFGGAERHKVGYSLATPKMLLTYGVPVMLTGVAGMLLTYTDTALLTLFSTLEQVGVYQAALPTANILLVFVGVLHPVIMPLVTELWERDERKLLGEAIRDLYRYAVLLILPLIISIVVYPDIVLNLLFGAQYLAGAPILRVLALVALFLTLQTVNAATLSGIGKPKENAKAIVVGGIVNVIGNILLIPVYGGLGAAIATLVSAIIILSISTYRVRKSVSYRLPWGAWTKILFSAAMFCLVIWSGRVMMVGLDQYVKIVLCVLTGAAVYVGCLFLTRVITKMEIVDLYSRIAKRR